MIGLDPKLLNQLKRQKRGPVWSFYCPICEVPRKLQISSRPDRPIYWIKIGLTALVATLALYPWMGLKGLVSFVPLWSIFEIVYRLRIRAHSKCPHCGFDPFLAMTNVPKAKLEVKSYWDKKFKEYGIPTAAPEATLQPTRNSTQNPTKNP